MQPQTVTVGARYGRLVVVATADPTSDGRKRWRFAGATARTVKNAKGGRPALRKHHELRLQARDSLRALKTTHGRSDDVIYKSWVRMAQRCFNPNDDKFPDYGSRGISVCPAGQLRSLYGRHGSRPAGYTLDRINVNGRYEHSNCRWAPPFQAETAAIISGVEHNRVRMVASRLRGFSNRHLLQAPIQHPP